MKDIYMYVKAIYMCKTGILYLYNSFLQLQDGHFVDVESVLPCVRESFCR